MNATAIDPHRIEWRQRLIEFLLPRISGATKDKETAFDMINAAVHQSHEEGVLDCAFVLQRLAEATTGERQSAFKIAEKAIRSLAEANSKDFERRLVDTK
jgi:glycyl-tRNA synthetase beta subunit